MDHTETKYDKSSDMHHAVNHLDECCANGNEPDSVKMRSMRMTDYGAMIYQAMVFQGHPEFPNPKNTLAVEFHYPDMVSSISATCRDIETEQDFGDFVDALTRALEKRDVTVENCLGEWVGYETL